MSTYLTNFFVLTAIKSILLEKIELFHLILSKRSDTSIAPFIRVEKFSRRGNPSIHLARPSTTCCRRNHPHLHKAGSIA